MRGPDDRWLTPAQTRLLHRLREDPTWRPKRARSQRTFDILVERGVVEIVRGRVTIHARSGSKAGSETE